MGRLAQSMSLALMLGLSGPAIAEAPPQSENAPSAALYAKLGMERRAQAAALSARIFADPAPRD